MLVYIYIYANIKGVYIDGIHVIIYGSTMDPSWGIEGNHPIFFGILPLIGIINIIPWDINILQYKVYMNSRSY